MSTILKALKKLEQNREEMSAEKRGSSGTFRTRYAVQRAVRSTWFGSVGIRWIRILSLFAAGLVVAYLFLQFRGPENSAHGTGRTGLDAPSAHEEAAAAATPQPDGPRNPEADHRSSPDTFAGDEKVEPKITDRNQPQQPASVQDFALNTKDRSVVSPAARKPALDGQRALPPAANSGGREKGTLPAASLSHDNEYAHVQRLTNGKIKVQAIAWAPRDQDRMAVVNNRVVREGLSVEGFSVVSIQKDAVIIRENGQTWRVVFGQP